MITTALTAILALIEQVLPLLGVAGSPLITTIITALENILPLIVNEIPTVYDAVKNIITVISADPATTATQLAALQALDAQVDAAFDTAAAAVNPDASVTTPPPATTT
jgi:UDP-N-acetylmuramyl tripeptide synthase